MERLIGATRSDRNEARDRCLLLLMFRHGLRVSEACRLKLDQVDTQGRVLHIARLKSGLSTTQPLRGDELRAISSRRPRRAEETPPVLFENGHERAPPATRPPTRPKGLPATCPPNFS